MPGWAIPLWDWIPKGPQPWALVARHHIHQASRRVLHTCEASPYPSLQSSQTFHAHLYFCSGLEAHLRLPWPAYLHGAVLNICSLSYRVKFNNSEGAPTCAWHGFSDRQRPRLASVLENSKVSGGHTRRNNPHEEYERMKETR